MRTLLIVDPSLLSLEGHSYNYDRAIFEAAQGRFDEVVLYADRGFRDNGQRAVPCRPVLNRLPIALLKRWANAVFHVAGRGGAAPAPSAAQSAHATVVPGVWGWIVRLGKRLRARDLESSVRAIIAGQGGNEKDELHLLFQHANLAELLVADRLRRAAGSGPVHLHLVLRYSPELVNAEFFAAAEFASLLQRIAASRAPLVHFLTDSERLSAEYRALGVRQVATLPVPVLLPEEEPAAQEAGRVDVAFLGSARVEKGFCELPALVQAMPRKAGGIAVRAVIQVTSDSPDPRVRATLDELRRMEQALPAGALELRASPVPMPVYYSWVRSAGIVALPYISDKYNASTSGIFVEAICFGVPVLAPANSWMADMIGEAERIHGLRIGEVFAGLGEIPVLVAKMAADNARYRADVRQYSKLWRQTHNPGACLDVMMAAA
jgi:glycosyltransferase involved in cell wall biosynthesis